MIDENISRKRYYYEQSEGYKSRSLRRLRNDLGVDEAGAEVILHLRNQIIELQYQIRRLETELSNQNASQTIRLTLYREEYLEATCIEKKWVDTEG